jgi:hypothetical protein
MLPIRRNSFTTDHEMTDTNNIALETGSMSPAALTSSVADDKLSGVPEIAAEIGENQRRTYYLLEKGLIPAGKLGATWVASRRALREHFARLTGAAGA